MGEQDGLKSLVSCIAEQSAARATGAIEVSTEARIYLVFGHPLHATCGRSVGMEAVEAIADMVVGDTENDVKVTWSAGQTAGKAHSLAVSDHVLDRLRSRLIGDEISQELPSPDPVGGAAIESPTRYAVEPSAPADTWARVQASICDSLGTRLPRHAADVSESIRSADPDPQALLIAIDRARLMTPRMVATGRLQMLLDESALEVRKRLPGA